MLLYQPSTMINLLVLNYPRICETLPDLFSKAFSLQVHVPLILPTVHCPVTTCELTTTLIQAENSSLATSHFRFRKRRCISNVFNVFMNRGIIIFGLKSLSAIHFEPMAAPFQRRMRQNYIWHWKLGLFLKSVRKWVLECLRFFGEYNT